MEKKVFAVITVALTALMISVNASAQGGFFQRWRKTPADTKQTQSQTAAQKTAQTTPVKSVQEPTDAQKVAVSRADRQSRVSAQTTSTSKPTREDMSAAVIDDIEQYGRDITDKVPGLISVVENGRTVYKYKKAGGEVTPLADLDDKTLYGLYIKVRNAATVLHTEEIARQLDAIENSRVPGRYPRLVPVNPEERAPSVVPAPPQAVNVPSTPTVPREGNAAPTVPSTAVPGASRTGSVSTPTAPVTPQAPATGPNLAPAGPPRSI